MFVGTIPGIHHAGFQKPGQEMGRAGRAVSDDDDISVKRLEIPSRVFKCFTFLEGRRLGGEINDIGAKALRRQLKADACACRRFDKQVDNRFAPESGDFLNEALADCFESPCSFQHRDDFRRVQGLDIEQVLASPGHGFSKYTRSSSPSSFQRTLTRSASAVGTFLPTKVALMGSSRCPRSIRTASWIALGRPKSFR